MFLVPYLLFSPSSGSSFLFNLPFSPLFPVSPSPLILTLPLSSRFFDLFHPFSLLGLILILYSSAFCCFPLHTLLYLLHHSPLLFNSPTLPLAPCFSSCLRLRTPTSHMAYWFSRTSHKHCPCMAYKSATGRISDAHVHVEEKKKEQALGPCRELWDNARLMMRERERKGKDRGKERACRWQKRASRSRERESGIHTHILINPRAASPAYLWEFFPSCRNSPRWFQRKHRSAGLMTFQHPGRHKALMRLRRRQVRTNNQEIRAAIFHLRLWL